MAASFADLRKRFAKSSTAFAKGLSEWCALQDEACALCTSCLNMMNRTPAMSEVRFFTIFEDPENFQKRALTKHLGLIENTFNKLQQNRIKLLSLARQLQKQTDTAQRLLHASSGTPRSDQSALLESLATGMRDLSTMALNDSAVRSAALDEIDPDSSPGKLAALSQLILDHPCMDLIRWHRFREMNDVLQANRPSLSSRHLVIFDRR
ncbi:hypothetical protein WJX73_005652 [Symbiochloris irregularis]|uniref:Uncharacterized protein n=1 Tax=Symbiochloris irregularis TaxID=706552 RepID=A0AAW1PQ78_9CHLO